MRLASGDTVMARNAVLERRLVMPQLLAGLSVPTPQKAILVHQAQLAAVGRKAACESERPLAVEVEAFLAAREFQHAGSRRLARARIGIALEDQ